MNDLPATLGSPFIRKMMIALGALLLALLWSNARILGLRKHQDPAGPTVLSAYYVYHGMAAALEEESPWQLVTKTALASRTQSFRRLSEQAGLAQPRATMHHPKLDGEGGPRTR